MPDPPPGTRRYGGVYHTPAQLAAARIAIGNSSRSRARRLRAQEESVPRDAHHLQHVRQFGARLVRTAPLNVDDLYIDEARPPPFDVPEAYRCGLCRNAKSHPVAYPNCTHSHCYVCVRLTLEHTWACPACGEAITEAPTRNVAEEQAIARGYPTWDDQSRVQYCWEGLTFPTPSTIPFTM
ncbi:hypothetical protein DFH06DRAFT_1351052 [Mycena polygramma]|nr:hypothetical protein DFH06DRAFT_1351052 [Mycena polygramma]